MPMNQFEKPFVGIHPKILAQMKPSERPKTAPPKLDKEASLGAMRRHIIEKKPGEKELRKYFEVLIERLTADEPDPADD